MTHRNVRMAAVLFAFAGVQALTGCNSDKPAEPAAQQGTRTVSIEQGEAGGVAEETFSATATITDIDRSTRRVTFASADGKKTTFTAGPQVRNLDQLNVGDKVKATFNEQLLVFVSKDGRDPSVTRATELARAPKGAAPGAMWTETYEVVAKVRSIDKAGHTATLQLVGGETRVINVRSDVDLSRYAVGDTVVIRVTSTLSLVVAAP